MSGPNATLVRLVVGFGEACPDCTAEAQGGMLVHLDGCPVRVGLNRQALADRAWFRRHPNAKFRIRKSTWAERQIIALYVRETRGIQIDPYDGDFIGGGVPQEPDCFWPKVQVRRHGTREHLRRFIGDLCIGWGSGGDQYPLPRGVCLVDRFDGDGTGTTFTNHRGEVA